MTTAVMAEPRTMWAADAAQAWVNAAIACSQEESRVSLYRTLSVEFFRAGVQFVGCDGTMLFRTWAPFRDNGDLPANMPDWDATPLDSVVVMDSEKFALGFMKTLASACSGEIPVPLEVSIEPFETEEEPALGEEVKAYVLTLHALGQRMSLRLYDGQYPDWRNLKLGVDMAERVEGMTISARLFKAVGQLKGVNGIDLTFQGEDRAIRFRGGPEDDPIVTGVLMPMRRFDKPEKAEKPDDDSQLEHN
jgi:hypothetical protein